MKDFDFDELDRAVNSVLATKTKKPNEDSSNDQTPGGQITETADDSPDGVAVPMTTTSSADESASSLSQDSSVPDTDASDDTPVLTAFEPEVPQLEPSDDEISKDAQVSVHNDAVDIPEETVDTPTESVDLVKDTEETGDDHNAEQPSDVDDEAEAKIENDKTEDLSTIPVKRGRFMDVMTPHSDMNDAKKPSTPSRNGITITPSAAFEAEDDPEKELSEKLSENPKESEQDNPLKPLDDSTTEQNIVEAEAEPSTDPTAVQELSDSEAEHSHLTDNSDKESSESPDTFTGDTPFIPDVPVEKRPLNALSASDTSEDTQDDTGIGSHDDGESDKSTPEDTSTPEIMSPATVSAPKEFNEEIMAVEANETIATANNTAPSGAAATDAHPLFDTSSLTANPHEHHATSKMTWVIILGSLFLVGAALGVLYFLYGQA